MFHFLATQYFYFYLEFPGRCAHEMFGFSTRESCANNLHKLFSSCKKRKSFHARQCQETLLLEIKYCLGDVICVSSLNAHGPSIWEKNKRKTTPWAFFWKSMLVSYFKFKFLNPLPRAKRGVIFISMKMSFFTLSFSLLFGTQRGRM